MLTLTTCSAKPTACLTFCLTFFEKSKFFRQIITISQTFWLFSHKIVYFKVRKDNEATTAGGKSNEKNKNIGGWRS